MTSADEPTRVSLDTISAQVSRATADIKLMNEKLDGLMAFRWTISGGLVLIAFFGLSICTFVGWSLWSDNSRLITIERAQDDMGKHETETDGKFDDLNKWRFKTDTRMETIEEKEITRHK